MSQKQEAYTGDGLEVQLNPQTTKLNEALVAFQKENFATLKDGKGQYGAYTTLGAALVASQPATEYGLSHTQTFNYQLMPAATPEGTDAPWQILTVLVTTLRHVSGEQIESHFPFPLNIPSRGNPIQAFGAAVTYARRYSLLAIYGLAAVDDDADSLTIEETKPKNKKFEKKTGISRTPTRPDSQVKKTEVKNNKFMTPAAREEIGGKISALNDSDKARVLSAFKQEFNISADQISPQHITLASHGEFLQQAIEKLA